MTTKEEFDSAGNLIYFNNVSENQLDIYCHNAYSTSPLISGFAAANFNNSNVKLRSSSDGNMTYAMCCSSYNFVNATLTLDVDYGMGIYDDNTITYAGSNTLDLVVLPLYNYSDDDVIAVCPWDVSIISSEYELINSTPEEAYKTWTLNKKGDISPKTYIITANGSKCDVTIKDGETLCTNESYTNASSLINVDRDKDKGFADDMLYNDCTFQFGDLENSLTLSSSFLMSYGNFIVTGKIQGKLAFSNIRNVTIDGMEIVNETNGNMITCSSYNSSYNSLGNITIENSILTQRSYYYIVKYNSLLGELKINNSTLTHDYSTGSSIAIDAYKIFLNSGTTIESNILGGSIPNTVILGYDITVNGATVTATNLKNQQMGIGALRVHNSLTINSGTVNGNIMSFVTDTTLNENENVSIAIHGGTINGRIISGNVGNGNTVYMDGGAINYTEANLTSNSSHYPIYRFTKVTILGNAYIENLSGTKGVYASNYEIGGNFNLVDNMSILNSSAVKVISPITTTAKIKLDLASTIASGSIVVVDGKDYLDKFATTSSLYELEVSGNDLIAKKYSTVTYRYFYNGGVEIQSANISIEYFGYDSTQLISKFEIGSGASIVTPSFAQMKASYSTYNDLRVGSVVVRKNAFNYPNPSTSEVAISGNYSDGFTFTTKSATPNLVIDFYLVTAKDIYIVKEAAEENKFDYERVYSVSVANNSLTVQTYVQNASTNVITYGAIAANLVVDTNKTMAEILNAIPYNNGTNGTTDIYFLSSFGTMSSWKNSSTPFNTSETMIFDDDCTTNPVNIYGNIIYSGTSKAIISNNVSINLYGKITASNGYGIEQNGKTLLLCFTSSSKYGTVSAKEYGVILKGNSACTSQSSFCKITSTNSNALCIASSVSVGSIPIKNIFSSAEGKGNIYLADGGKLIYPNNSTSYEYSVDVDSANVIKELIYYMGTTRGTITFNLPTGGAIVERTNSSLYKGLWYGYELEVIYELEGIGSFETKNASYYPGDLIAEDIITEGDRKFLGYYTDSSFAEESKVTSTALWTGKKTVYAKFQPEKWNFYKDDSTLNIYFNENAYIEEYDSVDDDFAIADGKVVINILSLPTIPAEFSSCNQYHVYIDVEKYSFVISVLDISNPSDATVFLYVNKYLYDTETTPERDEISNYINIGTINAIDTEVGNIIISVEENMNDTYSLKDIGVNQLIAKKLLHLCLSEEGNEYLYTANDLPDLIAIVPRNYEEVTSLYKTVNTSSGEYTSGWFSNAYDVSGNPIEGKNIAIMSYVYFCDSNGSDLFTQIHLLGLSLKYIYSSEAHKFIYDDYYVLPDYTGTVGIGDEFKGWKYATEYDVNDDPIAFQDLSSSTIFYEEEYYDEYFKCNMLKLFVAIYPIIDNKTYYVSLYETKGGTLIDTLSGFYNESLPDVSTPTRKGYTFVKWMCVDSTEDFEIDFEDNCFDCQDHDVYAVWKERAMTEITLVEPYHNVYVLNENLQETKIKVKYDNNEEAEVVITSEMLSSFVTNVKTNEGSATVTYTFGGVTKTCAMPYTVIDKYVPTVTTNPISSVETYTSTLTLADVSIITTNAVTSVPGSFLWTNPATTLSAGTNSYEITFVPTDSVHYSSITLNINVTVEKATYSGITHEACNTTYTPSLTLADVTLNTNYRFASPTTSLSAGNNQVFNAYYNADTTNYNDFALNITVNVSQASYTLDGQYEALAEKYDATYNNTLASITLPTGWSFDQSLDTKVGNYTGNETRSFAATYTAKNTNYANTTGVVYVKVAKATYTGITHEACNTTYTTSLTLADVTLNANYRFASPTTSLSAGNNQVFEAIYNADTTNYNDFALNITVNVSQASYTLDGQYEALAEKYDATYNSTLASITLPTGWSFNQSLETKVGDYTGNETRSFAATYTAKNTNYTNTTGLVYVKVGKADSTVNPVCTFPSVFYSTEELPAISLGLGDTEGSIIWRAGQSLTPNQDNTFYWDFTPTSSNYKSTSGQIVKYVTLDAIENITIKANPSKTSYNAFEELDTTGLVVKGVRSDTTETRALTSYNIIYNIGTSFRYGDTTVKVKLSMNGNDYEAVISGIVISKATYTGITHDACNTTYTPSLTLADVTLNTNYRFVTPTTSLSAGNNQVFEAIYNADTTNYNDFALNITVNVSQASYTLDGQYEALAAKYDATYNNTLASITLPTGWSFDQSLDTKVGNYTANETRSFAATYTAKNTNYANTTGVVYVKVAKATYTGITHAACNTTYTPTLTLADVTLNTNYRFATPTTSLSAGNNQVFEAIYNADTTNYNDFALNIIVNVEKASYEDISHAICNTTYTPTLTLADVTLNTNYRFATPTTSLSAGNNQVFNAYYNADTTNYKDFALNINVNVAKATYTGKTHTACNVVYTSSLTLSDVSLNPNYHFVSPTTSLTAGNNQSFAAYYNADTTNYENFSLNIIVNVSKGTYDLPNITFNNKTFDWDGTAKSITIEQVTLPNGVTAQYVGNGKIDAGEYEVIVSFVSSDSNYNAITTTYTAKYTIVSKIVCTTPGVSSELFEEYELGTELPTPTKKGHKFKGWYDNPELTGEKITSISKLDSNVTLYAKFAKKNTGAVVAISVSSVVVLAGGGFAAYWFILRKKKIIG